MNRVTGRAIEGVDHLRQSIADILGTPVGSRVGNRGYGSLLPRLLGQPLNQAGRLRLIAAAALALLRQERGATVDRISLHPGTTPAAAVLRVEARSTDRPATPFTVDVPVAAL